ncbi:regulatory protein Spx [Erysipelotrichaceae bacterium]|nr:regulatory protein Spx [Erysipelotrichaceae bacterium]
MITVYTTPSCSSCRKAKKWLEHFGLEYREKNLFVAPLNEDEIKHILERTENGTEDIISTRSKVIAEGNIDIDSMTTKELIAFIQENPSILRRPIIIDERRLQIGYNDEEIRTFIPRELRERARACDECPDMKECPDIRKLMATK